MTTNERRSPVTLHDVATEAGVSLATASRTLNGSSRQVKDEYRDRVLKAALALGYTANISAQAVARGTTTTVALLVGDIADPYFSSIAAGVVGAASHNGLVVTMTETRRDSAREVELVRAIRGQRPRVLIVAASRLQGDPNEQDLRAELEAYELSGGRVVFISATDLPFRTVALPNREGAFELGAQVSRLGYRSFAALTGPLGLRTSDDRLEGFTAGVASEGGELLPNHVIPTAFTRNGGYEAMARLIESGIDGIDLVFAVNDVMAVGAMSALRDGGLVAGVDLAVAGFDDIPTVRDVWPRLTTVHLPLNSVGALAVDLALTEGVDSPDRSIRAEVVCRESTPSLTSSGPQPKN